MNTHIVIGNWKMNPVTPTEAKKIFGSILKKATKMRRTEVVIAPSFVHISLLQSKSKRLTLGAQNGFSAEKGSFTGEVSMAQLQKMGVTHVIVGHSERRAMGENSELVNEKVKTALSLRLTPVICIGEAVHDTHGNYLAFLQNEIKTALRAVKASELSKVIIAYEPIWAIGKSATEAMNPNTLHETVLYIQKIIAEVYGRNMVKKVRILYGGSVTPENAGALLDGGAVQGFLVGGASLSGESFGKILTLVDSSRKKII